MRFKAESRKPYGPEIFLSGQFLSGQLHPGKEGVALYNPGSPKIKILKVRQWSPTEWVLNLDPGVTLPDLPHEFQIVDFDDIEELFS